MISFPPSENFKIGEKVFAKTSAGKWLKCKIVGVAMKHDNGKPLELFLRRVGKNKQVFRRYFRDISRKKPEEENSVIFPSEIFFPEEEIPSESSKKYWPKAEKPYYKKEGIRL